MASLVFPQLSSGAMAEYPLRKRQLIQSPLNAFADGSLTVSGINVNYQKVWELAYTELTSADQASLQSLFQACRGPLRPFLFIDPTDNMLSNSTDFTLGSWSKDPQLSIIGGAVDPLGGSTAFTVTNFGAATQQLIQTVSAPANFQYCFSLYGSAPVPSSLALGLGLTSQPPQSQSFAVGATWKRLVNSAQLLDNSTSFTVNIIVPAAQTVVIWGPQLEPQRMPSHYRPTATSGGIYQNAHFLGNSLTFQSDAPGLFSTLINIETT